MKAFGAVLAAATLFAKVALADVDPIVIKGSKFFYKTNGTQFYMKGVAYQQEYMPNGGSTSNETNTQYTDPISDDSSCERDIPYLQQLGTNTIRVYALDPTKKHDKCMTALANAGIYVIADLSAPGQSIIRSSPSWNDDLYSRYAQVIDAMAGYSNTLGFFAGNEVTNNDTNTDASAFVKAAVRDMKAYIAQKNYRSIGVGYATSDDAGIRELVKDYFDCGDDRANAIDFWGYNIYSWCGDSSYTLSGYDQRTAEFENYNVPVFFAEYGCNEVTPRTFTEVQALYGENMTSVWSGGIVYMYFQEANNYGLVTVSGDSVSTLADFNNLSEQIASISPTSVNMADYNPTNTAPADCPAVGATWAASDNLPPTPNRELCQCMYSALTCVPHDVSDEDAGDLFGVVCGLGAKSEVCAGITNNATTGEYGAYGMCNPQEQLGWALNAYYLAQDSSNKASACDFSGSATTQSTSALTGQCSSLVAEAGSRGTGTVTSKPSGTGNVGSGSSSSGSGNAAPRLGSTAVFGTEVAIAAYVGLAVVSGMCMIFL